MLLFPSSLLCSSSSLSPFPLPTFPCSLYPHLLLFCFLNGRPIVSFTVMSVHYGSAVKCRFPKLFENNTTDIFRNMKRLYSQIFRGEICSYYIQWSSQELKWNFKVVYELEDCIYCIYILRFSWISSPFIIVCSSVL